MAQTTQKDGSWSDTSVWAGGVLPANNETITIAHNIIYNYDNSAMATGYGAITIAAGKSLTASTTAGNYYLKMAGNITASGAGAELRAGTADTSYPTNCTFTIYLNGNYSIDGGASNYLTCKFYCYDPPVKYLRLISATPKAITGISKSTTCTVTCVGHGYNAGDTIYLVNVGGMVELNNLRVKVKTVLGADSFTIRAYDADVVVDSTQFTTYTSGGYACPETGEAAGQTQLEVDQDVSADAEWTRAGATVNIDNVARVANSEARTLASVAAGSVTVTAGLTAAKHSSALVILTSRNVTLQSSATNIDNGIVYWGSGHVLNCASKVGNASTSHANSAASTTFGGVVSGGTYGVNSGSDCTISGVVSGCSNGVESGSGCTISGVVSGCSYGINYGTGCIVSGVVSGCSCGINYGTGCIVSGVVSGCSYGVTWGSGHAVSGVISGCFCGVYASSVFCYNAKLNGNNYDLLSNGPCVLHNSLLPSGTEYYGYNTSDIQAWNITQSFDHDGVAGAFRSWTRGGITSSTETDPPTGRVRSYRHVCESADYPCWFQREINVEAGATLNINYWMKSDADTYHSFQLVLPTADPLINDSSSPEFEQLNTIDGTWHQYNTTWTNSNTYPVTIYARFLAKKNTTGISAYSDIEVVSEGSCSDSENILSNTMLTNMFMSYDCPNVRRT